MLILRSQFHTRLTRTTKRGRAICSPEVNSFTFDADGQTIAATILVSGRFSVCLLDVRLCCTSRARVLRAGLVWRLGSWCGA